MNDCTEYTNAIAYYRVSTQKQGASGLGLEAQRQAVQKYAASNCLTILEEHTEVETGTNKRQRPTLAQALEAAREHGAVLLIAKLDRLARNVAFISWLMESGVKFVACDMPQVDNLTVHILAAVAEQEAKLIGQRTKAALDVKRERDGEWRVSQLTQADRQKGADVRRQQAIEAYAGVGYTASLLREQGYSLRNIAKQLNKNGYKTRTGKQFTQATVKRILDRRTEANA